MGEISSQEILLHIIHELRDTHHCHTAILYGSHARGDATEKSDYDVAAFRPQDGEVQIARRYNNAFLDLFIFPDSKLASIDESILHLEGGKVLFQKDNLGSRFLQNLNSFIQSGPPKIPEDVREGRLIWMDKMLERIQVGDTEGNYRRTYLLAMLIEDLFTLKGLWYRGPKTSFILLQKNQPELFNLFERGLNPKASFQDIVALVHAVQSDIRTTDH